MNTSQWIDMKRMLGAILVLAVLSAAAWALWPVQPAAASWAGVASETDLDADIAQVHAILGMLGAYLEPQDLTEAERLLDVVAKALAPANLGGSSVSIDIAFGPRTIDGYVGGGVTLQLVDESGAAVAAGTLWRLRFVRGHADFQADGLMESSRVTFDNVGARGATQLNGGTVPPSTDVWVETYGTLVVDVADLTRGAEPLAGYLVVEAHPLDPGTYTGTSVARWVSLAGDAG